jgi:glycosyltransferase involved in cell wall biosynthesis
MSGQPLHVLVTADAVGGAWAYVQTLIDVLAPRGVAFTVAVTGPPPAAARVARLEEHPGVHVVHRPYRLEWMPGAELDVARTGEWLLNLAARRRPDVVHVNGYAHAAIGYGAPVIAVAHGCVCSWFTAVRQAPAPAEWDGYRSRVAAGLRAAAAVIAPTKAMARVLEREHGCRGALVIPDGVPARLAGRAGKAPLVLASGRLGDEAAGFAVLDRAAARSPWPVYAAGSLQRPDGGLEAPRAMHALGELDPETLAAWMDRAAIFAHPARYDPFGLAPLEAARAGCALVLGDLDSLREIWDDAAVYVDPASDDALAAALERLAGDPVLRARLAAAARARAARYTSERMAGDYETIYHELADCTAAIRVRTASV